MSIRSEAREQYDHLQDEQVEVHKAEGMSSEWWALNEMIETARLEWVAAVEQETTTTRSTR